MVWTKARFDIAVGHNGRKRMATVEGFSNGTFGIDERDNLLNFRSKAWAIIHLQTGYAATFVGGPSSVAKQVATALTDAADWDFTKPEAARANSKAVRPVIDEYCSVILRVGDVGGYREAFTYPEERTQ